MTMLVHMSERPTTAEEVLRLARQIGVPRVRDLKARGIHQEYLRRLRKRGLLTRTGRGLYVAAEPRSRSTIALPKRPIGRRTA